MGDIRRIGTTSDILGEGPVWCPVAQALWWVDIKAPAVRRWTQATDTVDSWPMPDSVGSLAVAADGRVLVALRDRMGLFDPRTGGVAPLTAFDHGGEGIRANDGKCDRQGRFWIGTMDEGRRAQRGRLYRLDRTALTAMLDGLDVPNSLCWSPDGRTMYFADSAQRTIWAFPFDPAAGTLGERRVFVRTGDDEAPDGATVDAEGYVWSARYGGGRVVRHAPDGRIDRMQPVPASQVTSCAFGGPDLATLFITTATQRLSPEQLAGQPRAGGLFAVEVGALGLAEPRFAL